MTISRKQNGNSMTIALAGRLDLVTAPQLEAELKNGLDGITELVLDFSELEYLSSAGLRALLTVYKALYGTCAIRIIHSNELVKSVFEVTGLNNIFTIE